MRGNINKTNTYFSIVKAHLISQKNYSIPLWNTAWYTGYHKISLSDEIQPFKKLNLCDSDYILFSLARIECLAT